MSRYYCPFCSSLYQFPKTRGDGRLICGLCGDPLMKKSSINLRQVFGIVVTSAFISPLLIMIIFVIKDFAKDNHSNNSKSLVQLTFSR